MCILMQYYLHWGISSLYTHIPHSEEIHTISELLAVKRGSTHLPHNTYIIDLLGVVLENNYFEFDGKYYHQMADKAMGIRLEPSYANTFMSNLEDK